MNSTNIVLLGAGNVRCSPPALSSLAQCSLGENVDLKLWDADEERLDLFDRLARHLFDAKDSQVRILASSDLAEMLEGAHIVIIQLGSSCARKYLQSVDLAPDDAVAQALSRIAPSVPDEAHVASLLPPHRHVPFAHAKKLHWPRELDEKHRAEVLFQVLRVLNGEDSVYPLLKANEESPLVSWIQSIVS